MLDSTAKLLSRAFDQQLVEAGGTRPGWLILLALKQQRHRTQQDLAAAVGIEGPTLTHHLDAMQKAGLIARERDPDDRRVVRVELTDAGEELSSGSRRPRSASTSACARACRTRSSRAFAVCWRACVRTSRPASGTGPGPAL